MAHGLGRYMPALPEAALADSGAASTLAQIVETTDLVRLPDGREFFITPATPDLVDRLACFDTEREDMEDEGVALDWTHGAQLKSRGRWLYPILIQDGDAEPLMHDGGAI